MDPNDILKIVNDPDVDEFAERHGVILAMLGDARSDARSGAEAFTEFLHAHAPWTRKLGISLHTHTPPGGFEDAIFILGIQYSKYQNPDDEPSRHLDNDIMKLLDISKLQGTLNPGSFYRDFISEENKYFVESRMREFDDGDFDLSDLGNKIYYAVKYDITTVKEVVERDGYDAASLWYQYFDDITYNDLVALFDLSDFLEGMYHLLGIRKDVPNPTAFYVTSSERW